MLCVLFPATELLPSLLQMYLAKFGAFREAAHFLRLSYVAYLLSAIRWGTHNQLSRGEFFRHTFEWLLNGMWQTWWWKDLCILVFSHNLVGPLNFGSLNFIVFRLSQVSTHAQMPSLKGPKTDIQLSSAQCLQYPSSLPGGWRQNADSVLRSLAVARWKVRLLGSDRAYG